MPIRFRTDKELRCVFATGEAPVTDEDITQYQRDLAAHPDHDAGFDQLVDMRTVGGLAVTAEGVRVAGHLTRQWAEYITGTKLAIVAPAETAYGMARMLSAFTFEGLSVKVFREIEEAEKWIGDPEGKAGESVA